MKKLVSILTTLVLALQLTTAYAAGTPTVSISEATEAKAGDVVTLNLEMEDVPFWTYVHFVLEYDQSALKLKSVSSKVEGIGVIDPETEEPKEVEINQVKSQKVTDYPYNIGWLSATGTCVYNGTMAQLKFEVLDTAVAGQKYDIGVNFYNKTGSWKEGNQVNYWENVDYPSEDEADWEYHGLGLAYVDGSITLAKPEVEGPAMEATLADDVVSITAVPDGEFAGKFIVAAYNGDELAEVIVTDAAATASATITADYDDVKVMWWDSLTSLTSIVDAIDL